MPFINKIENQIGTIGIWEITETSDTLQNSFLFSDSENREFVTIKFEKRKAEFIIIRLLLERILGSKQNITYDKTGKPSLKNQKLYVSISHCSTLVTVIVSKQNIGIDAENTERNIDKVALRFLHKNELNFIEKNNDSQKLKIIYWSAKEAIFKCAKEQGIQFNVQIFIEPLKMNKKGGKIGGTLKTATSQRKYNLWYFFYKNIVVVYGVENEK